MNKLNFNPNGNYLTVKGAMENLNVSRNTLMKIAAESGALVKITDRVIRINMTKIDRYLEEHCTA